MLSLQEKNSMLGRVQWMLGGSALLVCAAFGFFAYRPMSNQLASLNDRTSQQRAELASLKDHTIVLGSVKSDVDRLRGRLKEYKVEAGAQPLGQFYKEIGAIQQQNSLKNPKSHLDALAKRDQLTEIPIQLEFDGDFSNVYAFLRQAEDLPRLTRVPRIKMTRITDKNGQVNVHMTMNLYTTASAN
jgi:type IV pilus assembly protein PilO